MIGNLYAKMKHYLIYKLLSSLLPGFVVVELQTFMNYHIDNLGHTYNNADSKPV